MKELVEVVAKALVDNPDEVDVYKRQDRGSTGSQRLRGTPHRQPGTTRESETLSLAILDETS